MCLVCLGAVDKAEFDHFGVGEVIECEEVGAGFFYCGAVFLERVGVDTGQQLAGAVA